MSWFGDWRKKRAARTRAERKAARKKRRDDCFDCGECGCEGCDCLSFMTAMLLLRTFLGLFRASAVDPHTPRPATPGARLAARAVRSYQVNVSVRRGRPVCNLTPSCSRYALRTLSSRGLLRGGVLVVRRLRACGRAGAERRAAGALR